MKLDPIALKLKNERIKRKLTQAQLGNLAGLSSGIISSIESGHRSLRYKHVKTISAALNMDPSYFFDDDTNRVNRLGDNIRLIRQSCGLTQQELATECGLTGGQISLLETGDADGDQVVLKIALALGIDTDALRYSDHLPLVDIAMSRVMISHGCNQIGRAHV